MPSNSENLHVSYKNGTQEQRLPEKLLVSLGKIVSNFESLNMEMMRLFCALSKTDHTHGVLVFLPLQPKAKRDLIESYAYQRLHCHGKEQDPRLTSIKSILNGYQTVAGQRNKIVHALWHTEQGEWFRAYLTPSAQSLDVLVGGYPELRAKTTSERDRTNFSFSDMEGINARIHEIAKNINEVLDQLQ